MNEEYAVELDRMNPSTGYHETAVVVVVDGPDDARNLSIYPPRTVGDAMRLPGAEFFAGSVDPEVPIVAAYATVRYLD